MELILLLLAAVVAGSASRPRFPVWGRLRVSLDDEIEFAGVVASTVRSGGSPREGLVSGLERLGGRIPLSLQRRLEVGVQLDELAPGIARVLPMIGDQVGAAIALASLDGGAVAKLFDTIAERARERRRLGRQLRTATAQVRLSALVVGGLPLLVTLGLAAGGRLTRLAQVSSLGLAAVVAGIALQVTGLAIMGVLLRSVR